jgi:hypothetical protein
MFPFHGLLVTNEKGNSTRRGYPTPPKIRVSCIVCVRVTKFAGLRQNGRSLRRTAYVRLTPLSHAKRALIIPIVLPTLFRL